MQKVVLSHIAEPRIMLRQSESTSPLARVLRIRCRQLQRMNVSRYDLADQMNGIDVLAYCSPVPRWEANCYTGVPVFSRRLSHSIS